MVGDPPRQQDGDGRPTRVAAQRRGGRAADRPDGDPPLHARRRPWQPRLGGPRLSLRKLVGDGDGRPGVRSRPGGHRPRAPGDEPLADGRRRPRVTRPGRACRVRQHLRDPGTPSYRQFLSASKAAAEFGAAPAQVAVAEAYFRGFGLSTSVHPDGLLLSVSGAAPSLDAAFGTSLETYRSANGSEFVSHPTPATLPAVAPWTGVLGLGNVSAFTPDVRLAPGAGLAAIPAPAAGCIGSVYGLTPCEVATAYDYAGLDANGTNGSGERIAVFDAYSSSIPQTALAVDFEHFASDAGLPSSNLSFLYPVPTIADLNASGVNPAWMYEDILDIEWARAAAPGAAVEMVFSPNAGSGLYFAIDWVVAHGAANVLSMSWGEPEVGVVNGGSPPCPPVACNATSDGTVAILGPVLELAAAEGMSSFAASGDCGAAAGTKGVAVNYPASSPYVTGVGATNLLVSGGGSYLSETGWSGNASGPSPGCSNQGGSGGGFSVFPRPYWQVGPGTVSSRGRGVPDVAVVGGSASPVIVYIGGHYVGLVGTSVGTPIWAGIAATADQGVGRALGLLNPSLYEVLAGARVRRRPPRHHLRFERLLCGRRVGPGHRCGLADRRRARAGPRGRRRDGRHARDVRLRLSPLRSRPPHYHGRRHSPRGHRDVSSGGVRVRRRDVRRRPERHGDAHVRDPGGLLGRLLRGRFERRERRVPTGRGRRRRREPAHGDPQRLLRYARGREPGHPDRDRLRRGGPGTGTTSRSGTARSR